jgi:hypothetical protein
MTLTDAYIDSVALSLHGFYTGVERALEMIAESIDQSVPSGEHWHQTLLEQMSTELAGVRPAVLSNTTQTELNEFRRFRHVVRNAYTHGFDARKLEVLVDLVPVAMEHARSELSSFADFLETIAKD